MKLPDRSLLLFGKLPLAGSAKTRLAPGLGLDGAARLYAAFLDDAVASALSLEDVNAELWLSAGAGGEKALADRYPQMTIREQSGRDLGERMRDAFARSFEREADYVVIVGSDHPTLPRELLERAFHALRAAHLVLGPSTDGGYYAIGLRRHAWPRAAGLFEAIPWSTQEVIGVSRSRARELDLCHAELSTWYDIDTPDDLERLRRDVRPGTATAAALEDLGATLATGDAGEE